MPSVTRKSQGSRAERREDVRLRLLEAIERLLDQGESFTEVSVERIVAETGISRSTFYVYFEDKGDLLRALSEEVIAQMHAASESWWRLEDADVHGLHAALTELVATYCAHRHLMAALADTSSYDAGVRSEFHRMILTGQSELAAHLRRGQKAGFVRADLDPEWSAGWISWMIDRGFYELVRKADADDLRALTDALTDLVWHALYAEPR